MPDASTSTITIKSNLDKRTLVVGDEESIVTNFPELAEELLACENLKVCGELSTDKPVDDLWQRVTETNPERLWIIGGDGTINLVGECLIRHEHPLPCWLTPGGTANDLARALTEHIQALDQPPDSPEQQSASPAGPERAAAIDLLKITLDKAVHPNCCANMLTVGTSARNTQHVTEEIKSRWGALAYLTQLWRAIGDLEPFSIRLRVGQGDDRTVEGILNLFIANGPYCGGGYKVSPPAKLDDGLMDVVVIKQGTTTELARIGASFLAGNYLEHDLVEHFTTNKVVVEFEAPSPLTLDGEAFTASRFEVHSLARYLPVTMVPGIGS